MLHSLVCCAILQIVFACCAILQMYIWFVCSHPHREQTSTVPKPNIPKDIPDMYVFSFILFPFAPVFRSDGKVNVCGIGSCYWYCFLARVFAAVEHIPSSRLGYSCHKADSEWLGFGLLGPVFDSLANGIPGNCCIQQAFITEQVNYVVFICLLGCCWGWNCSGMWGRVVHHIFKDCSVLMMQCNTSEDFEPSALIYFFAFKLLDCCEF
jgi:hypothetical protein